MSRGVKPGVPRRPRLQDLAREAGVGTATVERVLNARGNVAPDTARKVVIAARKLGYDRTLPALYHATIRIEVVLVRPDTPFFARLNVEVQKIAGAIDKSIVLHRSFADEATPDAIARRIRQVAGERAGLVVVAQDHPAIVDALRELDRGGVPVVLLVSDVKDAARAAYVGIDNESAGRTAGFFMRHMLEGRTGRVVTLCHSGVYLQHRQRVIGFSQYFPELEDRLTYADCLIGRDTDEQVHAVVRRVLRERSDLVGVYNAGGGNGAVAAALKDGGRAGDVVFIGHELTRGSRRLLEEGTMRLALDQAPELQVRRAVEVIQSMIGLRAEPPDLSPIPFRIVTPENLGAAPEV